MRRQDDWITTFSAQAVGFDTMHFPSEQRGNRNAKAGRLDIHLFRLFIKEDSAPCISLSDARNQKCEAGRLLPTFSAFLKVGGIRTPSISRANSEESEMRRQDDWITTFSAQAVGFDTMHFPSEQRGNRNAKAGRLDIHLFRLFIKEDSAPCISLSDARNQKCEGRTIGPHLFRHYEKREAFFTSLLVCV